MLAGVGLEWEQTVIDAASPVDLGWWWADALGWVVVNDAADESRSVRPGTAFRA